MRSRSSLRPTHAGSPATQFAWTEVPSFELRIDPQLRLLANPRPKRRLLMSKKLEGKIALVTGGSRGIGAAIAKRLVSDGAKGAITYTKGADAAASVVKTIEGAGGKAIAIQADATNAAAVKAAIEKIV